MIARRWRGRVRAADSDAYLRYLEASGIPALRSTPGNLGVLVFRTSTDAGAAEAAGTAEVEVVSFWPSLDEIRAFSGDDVSVARFFPDDDRYLVDRELTVRHDEVGLYGVGGD